ncbi:hypothetical protein Niako_5124 [Niastella koreensis GR20-10]|uniref:Uncharacterized protein n=1 Tax=Niastella koreensis (strain DSM 17620 / KACC 11465 / NBRC 106392 / GR20-10) TaxID=700598 RepID=G8TB16_NIAKG|nr:hypothetical protein Niako_5124 [Niastella koreensis GR20-10]
MKIKVSKSLEMLSGKVLFPEKPEKPIILLPG